MVTVAAFVIVIAGMRAAESILVPFLLAAFLAIICVPPLSWLQKKRVPTAVAVLIVIAGILGFGALLGMLIGASLKDFSSNLPLYQTRLQEKTIAVLNWLEGLGFDISDQIVLQYLDPGAVMRLVSSLLTRLGSVLTNAFLILITVIFILFEASSFPTKLRAIWGESHPTLTNVDEILDNIKRYMARKTLVSLATGVTIGIWLAVLGVHYAMVWGLLAFLLNFVPNIGSFIAAIPAILLALVQLGFKPALFTALGFVAVNLVIGYMIAGAIVGAIFGTIFAAAYNRLPGAKSILKGLSLGLVWWIVVGLGLSYLLGTEIEIYHIASSLISALVWGSLIGFFWDRYQARPIKK